MNRHKRFVFLISFHLAVVGEDIPQVSLDLLAFCSYIEQEQHPAHHYSFQTSFSNPAGKTFAAMSLTLTTICKFGHFTFTGPNVSFKNFSRGSIKVLATCEFYKLSGG